ncbi:hypothetical protein CDL12_10586 [Handroanthus impetiginosus]|uniref:Uncharacterized protein n=1 Tax=Handroanthus impetiginosus TaxID=429701 RepID=A0A2G9HGY0_9LAMI|nr:hypothetical protein CDL12_10586 [Handroanthus impetiginosus]
MGEVITLFMWEFIEKHETWGILFNDIFEKVRWSGLWFIVLVNVIATHHKLSLGDLCLWWFTNLYCLEIMTGLIRF